MLCSTCDSIDVGAGGTGSRHPESILGPFTDLVSRAEAGCEGCSFFTRILSSSVVWKDHLEELNERVIVFHGLRLDARKKHKVEGRTWSCDDLLFDVCVEKGYLGE
jgi:hypothetical protein